MRFELTHDTLAKQVYDKASAEIKARQRAISLVRRGLERYLRRKTLLNKEDLEEIAPHLENITFKPEEQQLIQLSRRAQTARRNQLRAITLVIILVLSGLSAWALQERKLANHQKEVAESSALASNALLQLKSNKQHNQALSLAAASLELDSTNLNGRRVWYETIFQNPDNVYYPPFLDLSLSETIVGASFLPGTHQVLAATRKKIALFDSLAQVTREFSADTASILAWDVSTDAKLLAAAFSDQQIRIWDLSDGRQQAMISYAEKQAVDLDFAPSNTRLLLGSESGLIELFDLGGRSLVQIQADGNTLDRIWFSPDGQYILGQTDQTVLEIWKENGERQAKLNPFSNYFSNTLSFAKNKPQFITTAMNDTAEIWNFTGDLIGVVANPQTHVIYSAVYANDGNTILTANADAKVRIYGDKGTILKTLDEHNERVAYAEFTPDDQQILSASGDGTLKVWDPETGKLVADLVNQLEMPLLLARFSSDGQRVLSMDEAHRLRIWHLDRTAYYKILPQHDSYVQSFSFAPSGDHFSTVAIDSKAAWWSMTGTLLTDLDYGFSYTAIPPQGEPVFFGTVEGDIQLYQPSTSQLDKTYDLHQDQITSLDFSRDGRWLLSTALDGRSQLWSFNAKESKLDTMAVLTRLSTGISKGLFSPDHQWALLADDEYQLHLCPTDTKNSSDRKEKNYTFSEHQDLINQVVFSPDGRYFASASEDHTTIVYSTTDPSVHSVLQHPEPVNDILFSPNSDWLITACDDGLIRIWDTSGELKEEVKTHNLSVIDLELSSDGLSLLSAGDDGQVILYQLDAATKSIVQVASFKHDEVPVIGAKFAPSGHYLVAISIDGRQYIWPRSFSVLKKQMEHFLLDPF